MAKTVVIAGDKTVCVLTYGLHAVCFMDTRLRLQTGPLSDDIGPV
ncbi:hypothetical protein Z946_619 [Sulfitobacter noctilucicola]|nr:hypothetical protein Z946_619 [Sulfitobacter noctilucicola]